jgi:hypothetical protein
MTMTPEQRKRALIGLALGCGGLLLADKLLITPFASWWRADGERLQAAQAQLAKNNGMIEQAGNWAERERTIKSAMFTGTDAEVERQVMSILSSQATDCGVSVTSTRPQWQDAEGTTPRRLQLRVAAKGSMAAISTLLFNLETAPRPLRISALLLRSHDNRGSSLDLETLIEVAIQETAAAKDAKPQAPAKEGKS